MLRTLSEWWDVVGTLYAVPFFAAAYLAAYTAGALRAGWRCGWESARRLAWEGARE